MYIITRFIAAIIPACLLSVAVLISGVHYDAAQAKSRAAVAAACGKELQKQCTSVPVLATTCSSVSKKQNFREDVLHWRITLCACVIEMQCSGAKAPSRVRATFLDV